MYCRMILASFLLASFPCLAVPPKPVSNFTDCDDATKKQIIRKVTKAQTKTPTVEELTVNLYGVYMGDFRGDFPSFQSLIVSKEFRHFLSRKPQYRDQFSRISTQRSVLFEACEDLLAERLEHPLYLCIEKLFGEDLHAIQNSLDDAIMSARLSK